MIMFGTFGTGCLSGTALIKVLHKFSCEGKSWSSSLYYRTCTDFLVGIWHCPPFEICFAGSKTDQL